MRHIGTHYQMGREIRKSLMPLRETMMKECFRAMCGVLLAGVLVGTIGCTPVTPLPPPPSTPAAISTFQTVSGKWAGILKATPRLKNDDWVTLAIREDGAYSFQSVRVIGIFQGQGTFALIDGKLRAETDRGWALATLYEEGGRKLLKVQWATKDGVEYTADLDPVR